MYLNFHNQKILEKQIEELKPVAGVCIFIDICGSTEIKNETLKHWIVLIGNTIRMCSSTFILFHNNVVKLIGDEIMIFIPDEQITSANENYATVLDLLISCLSLNSPEIENITLKLKATIHYCTNAYNISFISEADDYYGNDIDLTARLMKLKASKKKIVLSETFYQLVNAIDSSILTNTTDKLEFQFEGINGSTAYREMTIE